MVAVARSCFCVAFFELVVAIPQIAFPINSQVPPLAKATELYNFTFSQDTFTSSNFAPLTYTLQAAPDWLSLNSDTRTLSGTPEAADTGESSFRLIASDGIGSISLNVTLIVVQTPLPQLTANFTDVLSQAGRLSDLLSLSLLSENAFTIDFPQDTFSGATNLSYYATLSDRSPLPSWVHFDSSTCTISGFTPPPVPNPQIIELSLIASSVAGFAGQSIDFKLIISQHQLVFDSVYQSVQIKPSESIELATHLLLDGKRATVPTIANTRLNGPTWLQLDSSSLTLTGQVPSNFEQDLVQVVASDSFNDNAYTYINLSVSEGISPMNPSLSASPKTGTGMPDPTTRNTQSTATNSWFYRSQDALQRRGHIAAAVVAPIVAAVLLSGVILWCHSRRRRRRQSRTSPKDLTSDQSRKGKSFWRRHQSAVLRATRQPGTQQQSMEEIPNARVFRISKPTQLNVSGEQVRQSNEHSLTGLGVLIPPTPNGNGMHPLRSNAIVPPPRSWMRGARYTPQRRSWADIRGGQMFGRSSWVSAAGRTSGAEPMAVIPKCENCESDNLECLDCGSKQMKSALGQVRAQRTSRMEAAPQSSVRRVVEDTESLKVSSEQSEQERERQEAQDYLNKPLEEQFRRYQDQRRVLGSGQRFSNAGSGSRISSYSSRLRNTERKRAGSNVDAWAQSNHPVLEESPNVEGGHMPHASEASNMSYFTDGQPLSDDDLEGFDEFEDTELHRAGEIRGRERRFAEGEYSRAVGGIRQVVAGLQQPEADEDVDYDLELGDEIPSSDTGMALI